MTESPAIVEDLLEAAEPFYQLRLYVTGASRNSVQAIANIRHICDRHLAGRYSLEIIDVYQHKHITSQEQIIALPLLIKQTPSPMRRLIGNMSDTKTVMKGLGLVTS